MWQERAASEHKVAPTFMAKACKALLACFNAVSVGIAAPPSRLYYIRGMHSPFELVLFRLRDILNDSRRRERKDKIIALLVNAIRVRDLFVTDFISYLVPGTCPFTFFVTPLLAFFPF